MDKYIKMLIIKLSQKYYVVVTTIMYYVEASNSTGNIIKLKIMDKDKQKMLLSKDCNGKKELISEMMRWQSD